MRGSHQALPDPIMPSRGKATCCQEAGAAQLPGCCSSVEGKGKHTSTAYFRMVLGDEPPGFCRIHFPCNKLKLPLACLNWISC